MFLGSTAQMEKATGVISTTVGYIGGHKENPTYQEVKAHTTGHAEAVLVEYDAEKISYTDLCKLFFEIHDPAQTDGQGPDIGPQYRSEIFYLDNSQNGRSRKGVSILRDKGYEVNTALSTGITILESRRISSTLLRQDRRRILIAISG